MKEKQTHETISMEVMDRTCIVCETYAALHAKDPEKVAILTCEGACTRGEIARLAANKVCFEISPKNTARICLGSAFTKDAGQRNLVRNARKAVIIEGCYINCTSRMMQAVIPELKPVVVGADSLYDADMPFGINEACAQTLKEYGDVVAEIVANEFVNGDRESTEPISTCCKLKYTYGCDSEAESSCCDSQHEASSGDCCSAEK